MLFGLVMLMVRLCAPGPTPVCPFQYEEAAGHLLLGALFSQRKGSTLFICLFLLLKSVLGTQKSNRRHCWHHSWSYMSPSKTDPHPLFDRRQHPVCSRRLTLRLIILYPSLYFRLSGWNPAPNLNIYIYIYKQKGKGISLPTYRVHWVSLSERRISRHGRWIALFRVNHQEAPSLFNSPFSIPAWSLWPSLTSSLPPAALSASLNPSLYLCYLSSNPAISPQS